MTSEDDQAVDEFILDQWRRLGSTDGDPTRDVARQWREGLIAMFALAIGSWALLPQLLDKVSRQVLAFALLVSALAIVSFLISHWYAGKAAFGNVGVVTLDRFRDEYEGSLHSFKMARHDRARSDLRWAKVAGAAGLALALTSSGLGIWALTEDSGPRVKVSACFENARISEASKVVIERPPSNWTELELEMDELTLEPC